MSNKKRVAIIGFGYVGQGMRKIFPDALLWDPKFFAASYDDDGRRSVLPEYIKEYGNHIAFKEDIEKECGLAIVCVPTPMIGAIEQDADPLGDVAGCYTGIVEQTVRNFNLPLFLIKSTVPPGTTNNLNRVMKSEGKRVCFSPEFIGEGHYYVPPKYPDPSDPLKHDFMIIGGAVCDCERVLFYFIPKLGPAKRYCILSAVEAELVKYMVNSWGFQKVIFCNEWYEICKKFGASYVKVREAFLLDSRNEESHTAVFENSRFVAGKCFPKDLSAIIKAVENQGYEPTLLKAIWETNKKFAQLYPKKE